MRKFLILAGMVLIPAMVFSQSNKDSKDKTKKMTVVKYDYEKSEDKAFPELTVWYNEKGYVIEEHEYDEGTFVMHFKYEYDAAGNKIREIELDAAGKISKTTVYKYDSNNRRTEKLVYDAKNKLKSKRVYTYESW